MKNVINRALAAKKKILTLVVATLTAASSFAWEYENPGFEWSAGCELLRLIYGVVCATVVWLSSRTQVSVMAV